MSDEGRILYCHCAYAQVVPKAVKEAVLQKLCESGRAFEAAPDLCEWSARRDPALARLARDAADVTIVACFPRAVRGLFQAAGAPLPETGVSILNMRVESADTIALTILGQPVGSANPLAPATAKEAV